MGFECIQGCSDCCGIVLFQKEWVKKHEESFQVKPESIGEDQETVVIITKDMKCVFLNRKTNQCMVYNDRPNICRDFGIDPRLPCPFIKPDGTRRNRMEKIAAEIQMEKTVESFNQWLKRVSLTI
jgi:hypothetical protein